ncbi:3-methyladenine DNA glycosylase AlkD [Eubacterium pyruvativorans]|uniref:3-methyladenine DNA glycosylase AlkD n=1 Tax=Eubacterium pyruvativorans TaxID=155865 RepID=A0A1I7HBY4_9FIRM|nr:DNA alkylation repair protein [Eubacterium pyruvativorans]SFO24249.1 3-methyladenine DNA glycosylase AlkD [Eubacterium pyruvativorans]SFU58225.1 3-methyladenine DNA glycosylase AlkD [Eubacterium pyruvativorans]
MEVQKLLTGQILSLSGSSHLPGEAGRKLSGRLILFAAVVLYLVMLLLTTRVFHRIVTTELVLITGWAALEIARTLPYRKGITMTGTKQICQELDENFRAAANPDDAVHMAAYMRNQFAFYGIKAAARRACYKRILKEEMKKKEINWELLDLCWEDEHREMQYFVADYLFRLHKYLTVSDIPHLEKYLRSKQWWDSVDSLDEIIGNIEFPNPEVDQLMLRWSKDPDFWVHRAAIDHQRGRKENTNIDLLKSILVNNFGSKEFFINKAIGWALRDYSKTNPDWVRDFIREHRSEMAPLSVREGSKYV